MNVATASVDSARRLFPRVVAATRFSASFASSLASSSSSASFVVVARATTRRAIATRARRRGLARCRVPARVARVAIAIRVDMARRGVPSTPHFAMPTPVTRATRATVARADARRSFRHRADARRRATPATRTRATPNDDANDASSSRARDVESSARGRETGADADADGDGDGDGLAYRAASAPTKTDYEFALRTAIRDENYEEAARLRDLIDSISRDAARAVQDANEGFYRAFRDASVSAMRAVWAEGAHVQCLHPGSAVVSGARDVMESWEIIFASMPDGGADVQCADVRVHAGDGWGFATCVERVSGGASLAATNVFERQLDGSWRVVLHQAHGVMSLGAAPTKVDW